jgi:hypothetical protein
MEHVTPEGRGKYDGTQSMEHVAPEGKEHIT